MNIQILNCNNIDQANIQILEKRLNIKYALNGTGKSTIANAIKYKSSNDEAALNQLKPFKSFDDDTIIPSVLGIDELSVVKIFNEDYVNQYVFQESEIIKNSFEIFIKDDTYEKHEKEIEELIYDVKTLFYKDETLEEISDILQGFIKDFGKTKKGFSASGVLGKGLAKGNKIENIPDDIAVYKPFLKHQNNIKWLKWQIQGVEEYLNVGTCCPFCTSVDIDNHKTTIEKIKDEYEPKYVEHLSNMVNLLDNLSEYLSNEAKINIDEIKSNVSGITDDQTSYLSRIYEQIEDLHKKICSMKSIGFQYFKDVDDVVDNLRGQKINLNYYPELRSEAMSLKANLINAEIDKIITKAGILKGEIEKQKLLIQKKISNYKNDINDFLSYAGYDYQVDIVNNNEKYILVLKHNEYTDYDIPNANAVLSYGEKNAFALVLFMYDAINENPDLIILDDPISSFDQNKKFAILNKLFVGKNNFHDKTVLLLSHDFNVVIDTIYNMNDKFGAKAFFLENNNGIVCEKAISKENIQSYKQIALRNIEDSQFVSKIIYLRRLFEFEGEKNLGYQLLSNLFHKRLVPVKKNNDDDNQYIKMTDIEIELGESEISKYIPDFNYGDAVNYLRDNTKLIREYSNVKNGYEKLHYFRIINLKNPNLEEYVDSSVLNLDNVFKKYVNETFHIENDYLFQLNPAEYEIVPNYILSKMNEYIAEIEQLTS